MFCIFAQGDRFSDRPHTGCRKGARDTAALTSLRHLVILQPARLLSHKRSMAAF